MTYNSFDLPKSIIGGPTQAQFTYDAEGGRASKTSGPAASSSTTLYAGGLYERRAMPTGEVVHVLYIPAAGRIVAQETWIEKPVGVVARADVLYLHDDVIGSVVAVSAKNSASNRSLYRYDPYGRRIAPTNPSLTVPNPVTNFYHAASGVFFTMNLGFTGHEMDDELGLINMKGRIYDAKLGRFLTPDPVTHVGSKAAGCDRYAYVFNNPLGLRDPTGFGAEDPPPLDPITIGIGFGGGGGGGNNGNGGGNNGGSDGCTNPPCPEGTPLPTRPTYGTPQQPQPRPPPPPPNPPGVAWGGASPSAPAAAHSDDGGSTGGGYTWPDMRLAQNDVFTGDIVGGLQGSMPPVYELADAAAYAAPAVPAVAMAAVLTAEAAPGQSSGSAATPLRSLESRRSAVLFQARSVG